MLLVQQAKIAVSVWPVVASAFIVLRLADVVAWPWALVLAPIWGPFFLGFVAFLIILFFTAIALIWPD